MDLAGTACLIWLNMLSHLDSRLESGAHFAPQIQKPEYMHEPPTESTQETTPNAMSIGAHMEAEIQKPEYKDEIPIESTQDTTSCDVNDMHSCHLSILRTKSGETDT